MTDEKQNPVDTAQVPQTIQRANAQLVPGRGLVPTSMEELYRMSVAFCASGLMPKGMDRPEQVMVACQMGMEMGLSVMQSCQNIAVINGRPSLWGDMPLALVENSGQMEVIEEWFEGEGDDLVAFCKAKRKNGREITRSWSWRDAVRARLTGKDVWKSYPKRMCQMRARSWVLKDLFPDVIKGVAIAEYNDYSSGPQAAGEAVDVTPAPAVSEPSVEDLMGSPAQAATPPAEQPAIEAETVGQEQGPDQARAEQIIDEARGDAEQAVKKAHEEMEPKAGPVAKTQLQVEYEVAIAKMGFSTDDLQVFNAYNQAYFALMGDDGTGESAVQHYRRSMGNLEQHVNHVHKWSHGDLNETGLVLELDDVEAEDLVEDGGDPPVKVDGQGEETPPPPDQEPAMDPDAANDTSRWIAMRKSKNPKSGFAGYVEKHLEAFVQADSDVKQKAAQKWRNLYKTKPPWESRKAYTGGKPVDGTGAGGEGKPDLVGEVANMADEDLDGGPDTDEDKAIMAENAAVSEALKAYQYGAKKHIVMQAAKELKVSTSPMTLDGKTVLLRRCEEIEAQLQTAEEQQQKF